MRMSSKWLYASAVLITLLVFLVFIALNVLKPAFYENPILYYGSAIIQAYAALIAVPFTIWVIYMQSRFGAIVLRLFLRRVLYPFLLLVLITGVSAVTIGLSRTEYALIAYYVEVIVSLLLLPPLAAYIIRLMTVNPVQIVRSIEAYSKNREELLSTALHLIRLYLVEAHPDERAVEVILRRMSSIMSKEYARIKPIPVLWLRFRDFLKTLVLESSYLPSRGTMKTLMLSFLKWLIISGKDKEARNFIRYYRHVALRYMEEQIPSEAFADLMLDPVFTAIKETRSARLLPYALEQVRALLNRVEKLSRVGEISAREAARIIDAIEKRLRELGVKERYPEEELLRRQLQRLRIRLKIQARPRHPRPVPLKRTGTEEHVSEKSSEKDESREDEGSSSN